MGRHKLITDEEILDAARRVFVARGIGASTRVVAQEAGVSEGVLYQRFRTKAELFFAAMVPPALDVEGLLATADGDALEHLETIALALLDYFRRLDAILVPLVSHPDFDFEEFAARHPRSPLNRLRFELRDAVAARVTAGEMDGDPNMTALTLFTTMHSLAFMERLGAHGGRFEDEVVRMMVRTLWDGVAPGRPRRRSDEGGGVFGAAAPPTPRDLLP
ncbi:MAG: TetR/AcrR family transcriptional regulator [Gemmatimonadota bacterium]|nr:TetR/AcrR family transcriptional regulator [Gemmatimonadota bacterium]MDH5759458.1 TetR/AcrR family transcriptional regulator [Gemmatimonadota bacterium]